MKQTPEQAVVMVAFEQAEKYRTGTWDFADDDFPAVFDALDILFSSLSTVKQRRLRPPPPNKRGRKRTANEYAIGSVLHRALQDKRRWSDAVEAMCQEIEAHGLESPRSVNDSTLRRILDRYQRRDMRPRLWWKPRKIGS